LACERRSAVVDNLCAPGRVTYFGTCATLPAHRYTRLRRINFRGGLGLSRYLKSVQAGEEVIVLDRETPIARIVPFRQASVPTRTGTKRPADADRQMLHAMVERGALTHAGDAEQTAAWLKARKPAKVPGGTTSLSDLFLQMRDEERW